MKTELHRRSWFIVSVATALYAVVLSLVWHQSTARAERFAREALEAAERGYADVIHGEIEAALRYAGGALINAFEGRCSAQPVERMQELAEAFNVDEINIVDRTGKTIGSNIKSVLGFDFASNELTREFLALTNDASWVVQPFRRGVANPADCCMYCGMSFPEKRGFLQLGMSPERLRQNMYSYTEEEAKRILRDWHFSTVGWYVRAENAPDFEDGRIFRRYLPEEGAEVFGRYFFFREFKYAAILPVSFCYAQRNWMFMVTALVLAVLFVLFTYFIVRQVRTSDKLEAMHAAAAARTAADLSLARTIQRSALPSAADAFFDNLAFSLEARSVPAREVGGDFYDFYPIPGGRIVFLIADVAGKGIPAALFMMEAKGVLKNCLERSSDLGEAIAAANAQLCAHNLAEMFVTVLALALDTRTGVVEYVNAGHNRPFVRRASGAVEKIMGKGGRFLGMFADAEYRVHSLTLKKGDALFAYTDGVTEAMNDQGEMFGEGRLRAALANGVRAIVPALERFVGRAEQSDDLTGLVVHWHGEPDCHERAFASCDESLAAAVEFIRGELIGIEAKDVAKLLNAADEVVSNIVNYSGAPEFQISVERGVDRVRMRFLDRGQPYNPLSHVDPDVHAAINQRAVGGLGLLMVKCLVDRVAYLRVDGANVLSLIKRFSAV